jgi:hypothetical protein
MDFVDSKTLSGITEFDETAIAELTVISYEKLLEGDKSEAARLSQSCIDRGFFYLDLSNNACSNYAELINSMFKISESYFEKPLDEKLKDTNEDFSLFNICGLVCFRWYKK